LFNALHDLRAHLLVCSRQVHATQHSGSSGTDAHVLEYVHAPGMRACGEDNGTFATDDPPLFKALQRSLVRWRVAAPHWM